MLTMGQAYFFPLHLDVVVKSPLGVMPVPDRVRDDGPGSHNLMSLLDSGLRRNDTKTDKRTFYELVKHITQGF